jgi:hypothetical protein
MSTRPCSFSSVTISTFGLMPQALATVAMNAEARTSCFAEMAPQNSVAARSFWSSR